MFLTKLVCQKGNNLPRGLSRVSFSMPCSKSECSSLLTKLRGMLYMYDVVKKHYPVWFMSESTAGYRKMSTDILMTRKSHLSSLRCFQIKVIKVTINFAHFSCLQNFCRFHFFFSNGGMVPLPTFTFLQDAFCIG